MIFISRLEEGLGICLLSFVGYHVCRTLQDICVLKCSGLVVINLQHTVYEIIGEDSIEVLFVLHSFIAADINVRSPWKR